MCPRWANQIYLQVPIYTSKYLDILVLYILNLSFAGRLQSSDPKLPQLYFTMLSFDVLFIAILFTSLVWCDDTYYAIWPKDSSDFENNNGIRDDINTKVDSKTLYVSESATIGFLFWYAQLNAENLDFSSKREGVSSLTGWYGAY